MDELLLEPGALYLLDRGYVDFAMVKEQLGLNLSLYQILEILNVKIFQETAILEGSSDFADQSQDGETCDQLSLLELEWNSTDISYLIGFHTGSEGRLSLAGSRPHQ
jgi:hypothetical protein